MHIICTIKWSKLCIGIPEDDEENGTRNNIWRINVWESSKNDEYHDQQIQEAW